MTVLDDLVFITVAFTVAVIRQIAFTIGVAAERSRFEIVGHAVAASVAGILTAAVAFMRPARPVLHRRRVRVAPEGI